MGRGDLRAVEECIQVGSHWSVWKRDASLLVSAIKNGYEDIALALLDAQTLCWADMKSALDVASDIGLEGVVQALLERLACSYQAAAGESSDEPSLEQMYDLLRVAIHQGDLQTVQNLLASGCSIDILSEEEQLKLIHCAFDETSTFAGDTFIVQALLQNDIVSLLSSVQQDSLLLHACMQSNMIIFDTLITNGYDVNKCNMWVQGITWAGDSRCKYITPLMVAAHNGHAELVKKLIFLGAKVGMQDSDGYTALHYAAETNHIQCGIHLVEGGASVRTKSNFSQMPLDAACSAEFKKAIMEAISFATRKTLCIIGNSKGGKSTLIAALQAERGSTLGKIYNRFKRVDDRRKRTAGIETVTHDSQRYGEVLFFDFAGQHEYHGPHQVFLESLLSNLGISVTLLLVVKATEKEEAILHQIHRWLTPVALMATTASPPQVIVIGSFLDKVRSEEEATAQIARCIEKTRKDLAELPLQIVGSVMLNCRQPQSKGMDQMCRYLEVIPVPEFRAAHTQYSLAWVLSQIRSSLKAQAVQLQEFAKWIQDNKHNLPQTMPPPEEVCQDLSAAGHALYLPNKEDPPKGWLMLDLPSILHDLYGTLFTQSKVVENEFGLLHYQQLATLFPDQDMDLVQQLLVCLEFCIPVDPTALKVEVEKLTQSENANGWLFFPALISANPLLPTSEDMPQQSAHNLCWQLKTSKKHSISAHVLQTILLRLAAHFVVKQRDEEGAQQHCCSIWWNGIAWRSNCGINVTVHITNNRVVQVVATCCTSADKLYHYLSDIINDILTTVKQLSPNLAAAAYIVHPPVMMALHEDATAPSPKELFPVEAIWNTIAEHSSHALSLKDPVGHPTMLPVCDLFGGWIPSLKDIEKILWTQPDPRRPQSPAEPSKITLTQVSIKPPPTPTTATTDPMATLAAVASDCSLASTIPPTTPPPAPTIAATDSQQTPTAAPVNPLPTPTDPLHPSSPIPSRAQALLDTSAVPTLNDVNELIVTQVAAKWQNLAIKLGVKDYLIDVVSKNNRNDCEEASQDMLKRWLREERHTGGEERTWSTLLTALGRADFGELERDLRSEHFHK